MGLDANQVGWELSLLELNRRAAAKFAQCAPRPNVVVSSPLVS